MAGTQVVDQIQLGNTGTPANNFVIQTLNNGSMKIQRGDIGEALTDVLTIGADNILLDGNGARLLRNQILTPITLTNQQFVDFDIPSWVTEFSVNLIGLSSNGTSLPILQGGTASAFETSNYIGASFGNTNGIAATSGVPIYSSTASSAAYAYHGSAIFTLIDPATNTWSIIANFGLAGAANGGSAGVTKSFTTPLTRVRATTTNGTDLLDAGKVIVRIKG